VHGDPEFTLLGDAVWLDFVNTAPASPGARDLLPNLAAYHRWTKAGKLVSDAEQVTLDEVRRLRRHLVALAEALHEERQPRASNIEAINQILGRLPGHHQLTRVKGAWSTRFHFDRQPLALEAIARSAASTLSEPLTRVRQCAAEGCGLFFADRSPSHSRRFCSALTCGKRLRIERRRGDRLSPTV